MDMPSRQGQRYVVADPADGGGPSSLESLVGSQHFSSEFFEERLH